MAEQHSNWRHRVTSHDRDAMRRNVLNTLRRLYRDTPAQVLNGETRILEGYSYSSATTHKEYLEKIAMAIQNHTRKSQGMRASANLAQASLVRYQPRPLKNEYHREDIPSDILPPQIQQQIGAGDWNSGNSESFTEIDEAAPALLVTNEEQSSRQVYFEGIEEPCIPDANGAAAMEPPSLHASSVHFQPAVTLAGNFRTSQEAVWEKVEDIQSKYHNVLIELLPIIRKLQELRAPGYTALFMRRLGGVISLLTYTRTTPGIEQLSMEVLGKIEMFITEVVDIYAGYLT